MIVGGRQCRMTEWTEWRAVFFNLASQQKLSWDLLVADLVSNDFISAVRWLQFLITMDLNTLITTHAGKSHFLRDQDLGIVFVLLLRV